MQTTKPETAQQRPTGARMALLMLLYFIKIEKLISLFNFFIRVPNILKL